MAPIIATAATGWLRLWAGLLNIDFLPAAEVISLCRTFLAMDESDMETELAALKAKRAGTRPTSEKGSPGARVRFSP